MSDDFWPTLKLTALLGETRKSSTNKEIDIKATSA